MRAAVAKGISEIDPLSMLVHVAFDRAAQQPDLYGKVLLEVSTS